VKGSREMKLADQSAFLLARRRQVEGRAGGACARQDLDWIEGNPKGKRQGT
jgi:hypothetical protein